MLSVLILTKDEEANIRACLESLGWCDDIVVLDSESADRTVDIAESYGARVYTHPFLGFGRQRNWALTHIPFKHDWVLMLDADERVTEELVKEIARRLSAAPSDLVGMYVRRRFLYWGRWLKRSNEYPVWILRLVHKDRVRFENDGHGEKPRFIGRVLRVDAPLIDCDLKPIEAWFERHNRYSSAEALAEHERRRSKWQSSHEATPLRVWGKHLAAHLPGRPLWYFLYSYLIRGGFLEGTRGFYYCYMKSVYHAMIQIKKFDIKMRQKSPTDGGVVSRIVPGRGGSRRDGSGSDQDSGASSTDR